MNVIYRWDDMDVILMAGTFASHRRWDQLACQNEVHQEQHAPAATEAFSHSLDDDIVAEHFTRNVQFFGRDAQQQIMHSFVVVVGLGVSLSASIPASAQPYHFMCSI